ncbi:MAG TPA: radical SAM protein [Herpetosiphonaceae bacterium]
MQTIPLVDQVVPVATQHTNVLFVQLYSERQPPNWEPFSAEVLCGTLDRYCRNCEAQIFVYNPLVNADVHAELLDVIHSAHFDVIGLSIPQGTRVSALRILDDIDRIFPADARPLVLLGHNLPTGMPESFLELYPWTVVVRGWGDDALVSLIRMVQAGQLDMHRVPSASFVEDGAIVNTELSYTLPPAKPKRYRIGEYFACVETSRGCHYGRCTFCVRPPGPKNYWSRIPLETILETIQELKDHGVYYFTFVDEDFIGNDLEGARAIADGIRQIGGVNFSFSVRSDNFFNPRATEEANEQRIEIFRALQAAGLVRVFIGLESASDSQLKRYGKGISARDSLAAVALVKRLGIEVSAGFIMFDPFLTLDELREISANLKESGVWENISLFFHKMRVQKNTPLEKMLRHKNMLGELDLDVLDYGWDFVDPRMAALSDLCIHWEGELKSIYMQLMNLERTTTDDMVAREYARAIRYINLEILDDALAQIEQLGDDYAQLTASRGLRARRYELVLRLKSLVGDRTGRDEEKLLIRAIDAFLQSEGQALEVDPAAHAYFFTSTQQF